MLSLRFLYGFLVAACATAVWRGSRDHVGQGAAILLALGVGFTLLALTIDPDRGRT
jgi:hypothetical protein